MDLVLGVGTLIAVYVLAMRGRPAARAGPPRTEPAGRRRWQLSVDSIPEEEDGCQSDPAEWLDSDSEEEDAERGRGRGGLRNAVGCEEWHGGATAV